jgi:SAM-dependent methyltransferase
MRILDLACGAGSQTIQAARRVGPNGKVVASDISGTMLEHVRRNAAREGLQNIETLECAADELDITQAPFDASMCRMGLMLFPSPSKALEAVRLVLKPSARFAALVFTTPANNSFLAQPMAILLRHAGKSPPSPGQPGLFALGASGALESLMKDSGFVGVEMNTMRVRLALPSVSDALQLLQEGAGAYRAVVADLSDEAKAKAWEACPPTIWAQASFPHIGRLRVRLDRRLAPRSGRVTSAFPRSVQYPACFRFSQLQ